MKVDVAMCTWNSNKSWFKHCLASIKREIPICHFIVVDRFSNDGTVEAIKQFFPDATIFKSNLNLGKARQEAIKHVDTEWFIFVDDDIELCAEWFKTITSLLTYDTGAIAGLALPTWEWFQKFYFYMHKWVLRFQGEWKPSRGIYLSNTLIRTNLVRDWLSPGFLCSGEDFHMAQHISKKQHATLLLFDLRVKHHGKWGLLSTKKNMWHYAGGRLIGYENLTIKSLIGRLYTSPLKGLYLSFRLKEPFILPYLTLSEFYHLKGWIQWDKYIVWKR